MKPMLLTKMVGLTTSAQIWKKLKIYYATQSCAKIKKLKLQLKILKRGRSVDAYVLNVKRVTDLLPYVHPLLRKITSRPYWMVAR